MRTSLGGPSPIRTTSEGLAVTLYRAMVLVAQGLAATVPAASILAAGPNDPTHRCSSPSANHGPTQVGNSRETT
jgi:hypothetical protein